jgi:tetratricopeptide (TPR) repeat protein
MKVALEIDPSLSELWYFWGRMHFHSNDLSKAEVALKKAISLEKNYSDAKGLLARVLERTQRLSAAAPLVAQVLKSDPKNAEATHVAAYISRSKNLSDLARRQDERAHFLDPSFPTPTHSSNSETTPNIPIQPVETIVFQPLKPNPSGRNNPRVELALPLLTDFLASDSSITLDFPTDTSFEQVLLRMIDSALTDSSIWTEASIDSAEKSEILQQFHNDSLVNPVEIDTSTQSELKTVILQQKRSATPKPIFDSLAFALFNDTTTSDLEKWIWIGHWIQNGDYSVLKESMKSLKNPEIFNKEPGFSDLLLAVTHERIGQPLMANQYFRKVSRLVPLSPRIFQKEKIPIDQ